MLGELAAVLDRVALRQRSPEQDPRIRVQVRPLLAELRHEQLAVAPGAHAQELAQSDARIYSALEANPWIAGSIVGGFNGDTGVGAENLGVVTR